MGPHSPKRLGDFLTKNCFQMKFSSLRGGVWSRLRCEDILVCVDVRNNILIGQEQWFLLGLK